MYSKRLLCQPALWAALSISWPIGVLPESAAAHPAVTTASESVRLPGRTLTVDGGRTLVSLWKQPDPATGRLVDYYGISLDGGSTMRAIRKADYRLLIRNAEFDPLVSEPALAAALTADTDNELYIVQFETQSLDAYRQAIEDAGGQLAKYLANYAYIVRLDGNAKQQIESLPFVRWVGAYHPYYRLDQDVLARYFPADVSAGTGSRTAQTGSQAELDVSADVLASDSNLPGDSAVDLGVFSIQVMERGPRQKQIVAERILQMGGRIEHLIPDGFLLRATLNLDQLTAVLHMNEVIYADPWYPPEVDMNNARSTQGVDYLENQTGFSGQGVRGEVFDTGVRATHQDFQNPPILIHNGNSSDTWHGTQTTGIVFADGTGNSQARGMLPDAEQPIMGSFYNLTNRYTHTAELVDPGGNYRAVFQTNSWGGGRTRSYTTESMEMDDILFLYDILITQSQSNAGNQDSRPQAWSKNIVSVGGFYHYDNTNKGDDRWNFGASIGPAEDGRIKPDLTNFYDSIYTTSDSCNTCYTPSMGGTSGATPIVAGHIGLIHQMWHEGVFPGHGGGNSVFEDRPHMSTAKALAINTADPYPLPPDTDMNRFVQGWGKPDLQELYDNNLNSFVVDEEDVLANLDQVVYDINVTVGEPQLRITMVYTDVAGTTSSKQHRINDLTLHVWSPSGDEYWGNNGLKDGNWSVSGGSADTYNTVENVFIENPEPGLWSVEVIAAEINEDSHTETSAVDADFALVVTGGTGGSGFPLKFDFPNGRPEMVDPDGGTTVRVEVSSLAADPQPGTGMLYYRTDGGAYTQTAMNQVSDNVYDAVFPGFDCMATVEYYFSADTLGGETAYNPYSAPDRVYSALVAKGIEVVFEDDFETDQKWRISYSNLSSGRWQRGTPVGGGGAPDQDFDGSGQCWVTELAYGKDVDGGPTRLESPTFGVSDGDIVLNFAAWHYSQNGTPDNLEVEVSRNDGSTWIPVTAYAHGAKWIERSFNVGDYVTPSPTMKLRLVVSDNPDDSQTESGLDAFTVSNVYCDRMGLDVTGLIGGQNATLTVTDATEGNEVYFIYSLAGHGYKYVGPLSIVIDLADPQLAGSDTADNTGTAELIVSVPNKASGKTVWFQAVESGRKTSAQEHLVN